MGKSSSVTVGYWYSMGLHMGLCAGPVDALLQINGGDDKVAWQGAMTASGSLPIHQPDLYGGEKKEGGIDGDGWLLLGEQTQQPNAYLQSQLGSAIPAFRGLATLVFHGRVGALNPYIKAWAFKVRKTRAGWRTPVWQPSLAQINLGDGKAGMNAAHLLYRCITDPVTGLGKPESALDLTRLFAAAQTLYNEGLGLCLRWSRSDVLGNFINMICDHVGGGWADDPTTGKQYLKLYRGDYDIDTCTGIDESNIIELTSYQQPGLAGAVNEVVVTWHDPSNNKDASVSVQNLANIQAQGRVVTQKTGYPGFATQTLATRAAQRDVQATSSLPAKLECKVKGSVTIAKGDVLAFSWAALHIAKMPMRVLEIERGGPTDSTITLTCAQDVYALPTSTYVSAQPPLWTKPNATPAPLAYQRLDEATWRDLAARLSQADLAQVKDTSAFVGSLGAPGPGVVAMNYLLHTRVSGASAYREVAAGDFAPTATLAAMLPRESGPSVVALNAGSRLDQVALGSEVRIDDELLRVDALDPQAGTATLARGCVDTVPAEHDAGARVWFTDGFTGGDPTEYLIGETVQAKLLMRTSEGVLAESAATPVAAALLARQALPYPPSRGRLNGVDAPDTVTAPVTVSWARRNRLTQADQLVDATAGDIAPEAGQTTTVQFWQGSTKAHEETLIDGTASTAWSPTAAGSYTVKVFAVRDSLQSDQAAVIGPLTIDLPP